MALTIRLPILAALAAAAAPLPAQNASDAASSRLETIVVTATRTEADIATAPATVSVKTAAEIERELVRDIRDLVRYEPGVSVGGAGDRFGLGDFTIRGIGGNRVLTIVDGIRVADAFSFGPFLSANRDYVDVDALEAFEIVRGPGSALYGSDALGGIVAFRTKGPRAYLDDESFHAGLKAGYSSADESTVGTLTLAGGGDALSGMLLYTRRDAHETETAGDVGGTGLRHELADPQDIASDNLRLELAVHAAGRHEVGLGADLYESSRASNVLSDVGTVVAGFETRSYLADDTTERRRLSAEYRYSNRGGAIDRVTAELYSQTSEQAQHTLQDRFSITDGTPTERRRDSYFEQEVDGLNAQIEKRITQRSVAHYLTFGAEYWSTDTTSLRDGGSVVKATGTPLPEFSALPTRDFPLTTIDQYGVYVQDEIALAGERLLLTPSLRFDSFDATAEPDAVFFNGNPGQPAPEDFADDELSPKIALVWRMTKTLSVYAQHSEGFKAPPYSDVNVGFTNPLGGYKTIANPDLESEVSRSRELGLRFDRDGGRASLVAYRNEYDNFIESFRIAPQFAATGGIDPADGLLTFQSRNLEGVEIEGLELSGELDVGAAEAFSLRFAFAYAEGGDTATREPVDSIDPPKAVFGLRYARPNGRWSGELVTTLVDSKDAEDVSASRYLTGSYGLVDLLGHYDVADGLRVDFGLFNIGDRDYIEWADTAAISMDGTTGIYPGAARYTRPGFNAGVTVRAEF